MPTVPVWAAGGSYSIDFQAADPLTYDRLKPSQLAPVTGRAANPLLNASSASTVESLAPKHLALGQIVAYEIKITVGGSVQPENGVITLLASWETLTTNGENFGYDPTYMVYAAFVDTADPGTIDPGANATASHTDSMVGSEIQGVITVSGLDDGDSIILEVWLVLKPTIEKGVGGNVQSRLIEAATVAPTPEIITKSAQTVPLLQVGKFFTEEAEVGVTKSDSPDPIYAGHNLTYTIPVTNHSTDTVSNGVVITDTLDANVSFVSASNGGTYDSATRVVTWPPLSLSPGQTVNYTLVVFVEYSAPTANFPGSDPDTRASAADTGFVPAPDLLNIVRLTPTITKDVLTTNNVYQVATNVMLDTTNVVVSKIWNDQDNAYGIRPSSVTVELLQNGSSFVPAKTAELNAGNSWSYTFMDLPLKDTNGDDYTYTMKEITAVPGYTTAYSTDKLTVTNSLQTRNVPVAKIWDDLDNANGIRPASIMVELLKNGISFVPAKTAELNAGNSWSYTFMNLPLKDAGGSAYIYTVKEITAVPGYTTTYSQDKLTITNTLQSTSIPVAKIWVDQNNAYGIRPGSITVELLRNGSSFVPAKTAELNAGNSWSYTFTGLALKDAGGAFYTYTMKEISAVPGYTTSYSTDKLTVTNTLQTTNIPVAKIWVDQNNAFGIRPAGITVELLQNGASFVPAKTVLLNSGNSWSHTFMDLPLKDAGGVAYTYTVKEITAVPGYTTSYSPDGLTVTNTLQTTNIPVAKVWVDQNNAYGIRPASIMVELLQNGASFVPAKTAELNAGNSWSYTFLNLPLKDAGGTAYAYTVKEITAVPGYTTGYSPDKLTITNTLQTTNIPVAKIWVDRNNAFGIRPSAITVELLQNGASFIPAKTAELNAGNSWSYTFLNLPLKDAGGAAYSYTVKEITAVPGYTTTYSTDKLTVTNTLQTTDIPVSKVWVDQNDLFGIRPAGITVELLQNGFSLVPAMTANLSEMNGWGHTFTGLPEKDANGDAYIYTVKEISAVPGYTTTYSQNTLTITNTMDIVDIPVTKVWEDQDNAYGIRPVQVTVELLQNGFALVPAVTANLNEMNGWGHTFTGLPEKDENGEAYTYTVKEISAVPGYTTTYSEDTLTVTNTMDVVDIPVTKVWDDQDNADGIRPADIMVELLQNGFALVPAKTAELNAGNSWSFTFMDLPEKDENGEAYTYTVKEISAVPGYTTAYSEDTLTITNTMDTVDVPVLKVWDDQDDAYGIRPTEVTVELLQNGIAFVPAKTAVLDAGNSWMHTFTALPETDAEGEDYIYTSAEITAVPGYTTTYSEDELTITNTLDTLDISVNKIWADRLNIYGIRPLMITVELLQNGDSFDPAKTVLLNIGNNWSHTFMDLPVMDTSGDAYIYTVKEITQVTGYTPYYSEDTLIITNNLDTLGIPIVITKLDDFSGLPLAGATFQVYKEVNGEKVAVGSEITSNAQGIATSEPFDPGEYFVKETSTPAGYVLDSTYHPVTISASKINSVVTITLHNVREQYPIVITKIAAATRLPLAGVKFQIYRDVAGVKVAVGAELITDAKGIATSVPLDPGVYYVKEVEAPAGFVLDKVFHEVTIVVNQPDKMVKITLVNTSVLGVVKTGEMQSMLQAGFALMLCAAVLTLLRRIFRKMYRRSSAEALFHKQD